ncbi:transposase [Spirillospora sp. NPDC048819]|uniref:transposase n=1 Tax=Spirillospora sp. NPDC048819 TaxID=3155268 RepID=UPI0033DBF9E6
MDIGRPPEHDLRTIMDAILYVDYTGIPGRYLPHDYTPISGTCTGIWNLHRGVKLLGCSPAIRGGIRGSRATLMGCRRSRCWRR